MDLSIIIASYNTKKTTQVCLNRLIKVLEKTHNLKAEVIVVDNASTDGSIPMLKKLENLQIKVIYNKKNLGFGAANNISVKSACGRYILFLNSDVMIDEMDFSELVKYMDKSSRIGALTVRVLLQNGKVDPASHRGFPTLWRTVCYYTGFEKILGGIPLLNTIFGGYHLKNKNLSQIHEVDAISGAFFFVRKDLFEQIGGFDEHFFMYGEDLDLSYRIKQKGHSIIYYPLCSATHLKYQSGMQKNDKQTQANTKKHFYSAMKIYYDKHLAQKKFNIINKFVHLFIDIKQQLD